MKRLVFLLATFILLYTCQKDYDKINLPFTLIPSNTNSVLIVNELNDFINSLENDGLISNIYNKEINSVSTLLKNLNTTSPIYISFLNEKNKDYLILAANDSTLFIADSIPNHSSESLVNFNINKIQIDSFTFYQKTLGKVFASSNNLEVLKNLDSKDENNRITKLIETTNGQSITSVIFKSKEPDYSKLLLSNTDFNLNEFTVLDLNYSNNKISYNGIITSNDSVQFKIDCFKNTVPQKTNTLAIAPYNTQSLTSITFHDFSIFDRNRRQLTNGIVDSTTTFLNFTTEIALIDNAILLHTLDPDLVLESIEDKTVFSTYKDFDIYQFERSDFFKARLEPLIKYDEAKFFLAYNDFIVFSNSVETLKFIVTNALNRNTLLNSNAFKNISDNISNESSLFIFKNSEGLSKILGKNVTSYDANAVQFIYEDNYAHANGIIQKFKKRAISNTVSEAFTVSIDKEILSAPQAIKNHITKAHDIAVQDVNNVLYVISNSGNILWKKQLHGKILGNIEQIDTYKNGKLQLAFTTANRLYVLDRSGNDINNFPLKFNDKITQPLSVFDYDKRKDYRLLVSQGKNLLMYNVKGKTVSGFKYKNNNSKIDTQPRHFRIASKDYIAFAAGETLKILNRKGNDRILIKEKINFSGNAIYLYKNKFTSTNTLGQLVQFDTKGKLTYVNLNLPKTHSIVSTSKTLVALTENKLNIKSRSVDLDYGDYTEPRIFYLNDKIYVSVTDLQSKKVYLFDSQAKSIPNFPVFGTSSAVLQKLDNETGLELITQADSKTVSVYKLY